MDEVGLSFSKEFVFMDVGDTCIIMELVMETQMTSHTTLDFEDAENISTIKPDEVLEVEVEELGV